MTQKYDAIVIGSGAAGSVMAYQLVRYGLSVAVLERGVRHDPQTFEHNEALMFPRVYKHGGLQMTIDNDLLIAQGGSMGGSTVINNAIWLRPDLDKVLGSWMAKGATVPRKRLETAYDELECALHVSPVSTELANKGTNVFLRGCQQLGINANYLNNNRDECIGCGWCNYGCKYNRKTSMLVTYIPWAETRGALFFDQCAEVRISTRGKTATGVTCQRNGRPVTISADRVIVSAGAIGSSAVLLQSGISLNGLVGKGFHCLGGVFVTAETNENINGFDGIGLTCVAHASDDFVIESYFAPPLVFSLSLGGFFKTHFDRMMRYRKYADAGVMVGTDPTGVITLDKKGNPRIDLQFSERDISRLRTGVKKLSEIYFAGGAERVLPATFKTIEFSRPADLSLLDQLVREPDDLLLGSAHPQGGNPMSEDPRKGVVDNEFKVHGYENLFVADASVFPTNLWANCQATVMAMSHYASGFVST